MAFALTIVSIFYRFTPIFVFTILLSVLLIYMFVKYSATKKLISCLHLRIPFMFIKALFGIGLEFDDLIHTNAKGNKKKESEIDENDLELKKSSTINKNEFDEIKEKDGDQIIERKFIKLYLQFVMHLFYAIISITILFVQILMPWSVLENKCVKTGPCFSLTDEETYEIFDCSIIKPEEVKNTVFYCYEHRVESFSEVLSDLGSFAGIVTIVFKTHQYGLKLVIALKSKLRISKVIILINKLKLFSRNSTKCDIIMISIVYFFELMVLLGLLVIHATSEDFYFFENEYLVYSCLIFQLIITSNSIEKRLFKANFNLKDSDEIANQFKNSFKTTMKGNMNSILDAVF